MSSMSSRPNAPSAASGRWEQVGAMLARPRMCDDRQVAVLALAGLSYYYLVPAPLLALPGLLLFAACAWRRLPLVLCLLPLTFPFWYVPKRVLGHMVFPLSEMTLVVCTAVPLTHELRRLRRLGWKHARPWCRLRALAVRVGGWTCLGAGLLLFGTLSGVALSRQHPEALRAERW